MGEQGEQADSGDHAGASGDATVAGRTVSPNGDGANASPVSGPSVRLRDHRDGRAGTAGVRHAVWRFLNLLAVVVRLVACAFALVLVVRVGLAFVAVNPHNVIVEWIVKFSDVLVWGFRDLFLPADPRIGLVANYGLAAVFWVVVGVISAWVLSGFGRLIAGRSRS